MRDGIFAGNVNMYNWFSGISESIATVGSIICGGWLKFNAPRIKAYKNIENYKFSNTLSDSIHMSRNFQQSILTQKQVIKYGKMIKEGGNIYKFIANGSFSIGLNNYHYGTWKLVVNIATRTIYHFGLF